MADRAPTVLHGVQAYVRSKRGVMLRFPLPTLEVSSEYLTIRTGRTWEVPRSDVTELVLDRRSVLVRRSDGTNGRFKCGRRRLPQLKQTLIDYG